MRENDEQNRFLKTAQAVLPGPTARKEFVRYVQAVVQDMQENEEDWDFSAIAEQLGASPRQAALDFFDSQPPEIQAQWTAEGRRRKKLLWLAVGATIAILLLTVAFFVITKGVMIVNTETTNFDFSGTSMTLEEQTRMVLELTKPEA